MAANLTASYLGEIDEYGVVADMCYATVVYLYIKKPAKKAGF